MGDCFIGIALLYLNLLVALCMSSQSKQAALGILSSLRTIHLPGVESGGFHIS